METDTAYSFIPDEMLLSINQKATIFAHFSFLSNGTTLLYIKSLLENVCSFSQYYKPLNNFGLCIWIDWPKLLTVLSCWPIKFCF